MTQGEVLKVLEKKKKWLTSNEIAEILDIPPKNVTNAARKLYKNGEILRELPTPTTYWGKGTGPYKWKAKE